MSDWIRDFFYKLQPSDSLQQIALHLAKQLNCKMPQEWKQNEVSGFHLAGLTQKSRAEVWYIRNIDDQGRPTLGKYEVREEFAARDALSLQEGSTQIYRNGDIRAHVVAWEIIDKSFGQLLGTPDFRQLQSQDDYVDWVRFKMQLIAGFYERFCTEPIIGGQIDAFVV